MAVVVLGSSLVLPATASTNPAVAAPPATCDGSAATIRGTDGDDRLVGTAANDVVSAGAGNDVVIGLEGADLVCAGPGDDLVASGDGRDTLHGEDGNDALYGERGTDSCSGGEVVVGCETTVGGPTSPTTTTTTTSTTTSTTTTQPATSTTTTQPPGEEYPTVPSNFDRSAWIVQGDGIPRSSDGPGGGIGINCGHSHLAYDDPIVFPGGFGASHLHTFAGNTATNANSTYQSLRSTGSGSCFGGPLDRTGYWIPAMHNGADKVVVPSFFEVYYTGNGTRQEIQSIQTYPNGLRMIAGFNMAATVPGYELGVWECLAPGQGAYGPKMATIPTDCPAGYEVRASVRFPMCWDGQNVDSANHRSHMAYGTGGGGFITAQGACPATHPIHVPEIKLFSIYESDGNTANWYLASDRMPNMPVHPAGSTYHADWFGAWDNQVQETWTQECIREMRRCVFGELGDGTRLRDSRGTYNGPMIVDPPPRP